jgi:hypothetical protein
MSPIEILGAVLFALAIVVLLVAAIIAERK